MSTQDREGYIADLRAMADILEANPDVRMPTGDLSFAIFPGSLDEFRDVHAALPVGPVEKWEATSGTVYIRCEGSLPGGARIWVAARPEHIGVKTVTRTKTVEVQEWDLPEDLLEDPDSSDAGQAAAS